MMMPVVPESVDLLLGPSVSVEAIDFVLILEHRGFALTLDDRGELTVEPRSSLTADDIVQLRWHQQDVVSLIEYVEFPPERRW